MTEGLGVRAFPLQCGKLEIADGRMTHDDTPRVYILWHVNNGRS